MTKTVTVGVDTSPESHEALRWAGRHVETTGGTLQVVTVWKAPVPPVGSVYTAASETDFVVPEDLQADAGDRLEHAVSESLDPDQGQQIISGDPATALLERAADADFLVLGNGHHGAIVGGLTGSVAQYCLQRAECPVVLVPAPGEQ